MSITVAIVEDDLELQKSLEEMLGYEPNYHCVAALQDAASALEKLPGLKPDVVLMDFKLPGLSGIECIAQLKDRLPQTQFLMLTAFEDHELIFQSLRSGATGYLLKKHIPTELLESIRILYEGGSPMSNSIARKVAQAFQTPSTPPNAPKTLSLREEQILQALAKGQRFKEIAAGFEISFHTVRSHVQNIYKKLHVRSKSQAVHQFQKRQGLAE